MYRFLKGASSVLPLDSLRVVDLSRVVAMPYAAAILADLGAEVVKVEACHLPDSRVVNVAFPNNQPGSRFWERSGVFHTLNRGKRSLTLDLRNDNGIQILNQLIGISDILIENYTPVVSRRFGLDYPSLKKLKPDLIVVSNTGYGNTGPWQSYGAVASTMEYTHGTGTYIGYDQVPSRIGNSFTDCISTWTALFSIMAALLHRARTGRGLWIDLSMYQIGSSFMGEGLVEYAINGSNERVRRNRHPQFSPHGCYPCYGDDEWVVLMIKNETQWSDLCEIMGNTDMIGDRRYSNPVDRYKNQDKIDLMIRRWTRGLKKYEVMELLQDRGIACGPVLKTRDMFLDDQFRFRKFFTGINHKKDTHLGKRYYASKGWRMTRERKKRYKSGPRLGADNGYVLKQLLGFDSKVIQEFKKDQVIGRQPIDVEPPQLSSLEEQKEIGVIKTYDTDFLHNMGIVNREELEF